ncbi:MAG: hypothetical protein Q7R39_02775 [Dehalococcoidia bacterium]|nr:hypothetical protein [Dehalococcoidia bacterium]
MKILHVIREIDDKRAFETARAHAAEHQVTLVLLQDAVLSRFPWDGEVCAGREDLEARGGRTGVREVEYRELVGMIFGHDRVIMW